MAEQQAEYDSRIRTWERKTPWFRRISARTGLQGKLVLSFMFLLTITLGGSSLQYISESREATGEMLAGKAVSIAAATAVAAEGPLEAGDACALDEIGQKILAGRDVVGIVFFHRGGTVVSSCWRDQDKSSLHARMMSNPRDNPGSTVGVRSLAEHGLGPYLEATVPVRVASSAAADGKPRGRVVGFVTICLSEATNASRLSQSQAIVMLIGACSALISLPLVYMLVHRIFHPIRALVDATNRIASGDLETEVAVHRPDVIGTLARSFNEMVKKVRQQQEDLETANEQLAHTNRDLEEKVRQRTAQVETANRRLRSEIAEKGDFLRAVSHDLNAPLRNISGMAAMLLMKNRDKFDPDTIHRLERIQKNVEVETDLIAELLELSRIKTRRQKLEPVDLGALVTELAGVLEEDLRSKQIALLVDTPLPVVECEQARMRQVFQNLIDNAIKYMGDGPVREIHVGCALRAGEAEFYVRDTGIGIEAEDLDKVFFVFRRGKSPTVQAVAGKGIGLASVKSIVETYEGTIWVQSEVGKGTTFRFTINGKYVPDPKAKNVTGRAA